MFVQEHAQTAREFLQAADREFNERDIKQASEKLWGAAAHVLIALAQQRGWRYMKHRDLKWASQMISEESGDPFYIAGFATVEKFHANFYHDFMAESEINRDRPVVRELVERVLTLVD